ncbi:ATP-binding cassette, subfamily B [Algoriella xinjiangensis]|uniref:ATP-binding cassette, subfamily B n=1 Tax=Algoriella xinjiangensis TaxID=684065 RepID=A0A1I4VGF7_9FLAO|nr:ATP-binding cassette, subfamily B [Algoriella xinjiangensis]VDH17154.1 Probable multidrug resistance ABC transporter ATP-binding/permease protein YheI [Algoriella xinjiangensis]
MQVFSVTYIREAINTVEELLRNYNQKGTDNLDLLKESLMYASLAFFGFKVLGGALTVGTRQMIIVASRYIEFDLKNVIYDKYQKLSLSFYKKHKTGDLMNRITEDVALVRMYLGPGIMYPIDLVSRVIIIAYFMIQIDKELTLYTLAPLPVLSLLIYGVARNINKKSKRVQEQQSTISSSVQDTFAGIRVIKSFNSEEFIKSKYEVEADEYQKRALNLAQVQAAFGPLMVVVVGVSNLVILYLGGLKYIAGTMDIGSIAQFFLYLNMLIWPFTSLGWITMVVQRAEASMFRINEFLNFESEIVEGDTKDFKIEGTIEFRNVTFVYENTGIKALDNVSFILNKGETLAILGKTGSGKSTIALLITRSLEPTSGEILIDGKNIHELSVETIRDKIGYVPQEAFLFSDTLTNNILFGSDATHETVAEEFAKKAVVHDNIDNFKERYNTVVGERGVTLSGGQKQRVSIARALVNDPSILIFDDSLSAVDTETEEQILNNLASEIKNKTTIIITHRVSSAKRADKILVLEDGRVLENGSNTDLLNKQGYYYELYNKQLLD